MPFPRSLGGGGELEEEDDDDEAAAAGCCCCLRLFFRFFFPGTRVLGTPIDLHHRHDCLILISYFIPFGD